MNIKEILTRFIKENIPSLEAPEKMAEYFLSHIGIDKVPDSIIKYDTVRVYKDIISGEFTIPIGTVMRRQGEEFLYTKDGMDYKVPANQVDGNTEFFQFPDKEGNYTDLGTILRMIPTPTI